MLTDGLIGKALMSMSSGRLRRRVKEGGCLVNLPTGQFAYIGMGHRPNTLCKRAIVF